MRSGAPTGGAFRNSPTQRPAAVMALQRNVQASRRFQAAAYRPPQGYVSRQWSYGQRLPGSYFARDYWISNYLAYALFAPPPGLVWVRVGYDALLIDQYTGDIIQVDYGVFY
jgi:Ni/Co efflux regulator RcnB